MYFMLVVIVMVRSPWKHDSIKFKVMQFLVDNDIVTLHVLWTLIFHCNMIICGFRFNAVIALDDNNLFYDIVTGH